MLKFGTKIRTWNYTVDELCVSKIKEEEDGENWRSGEFKLGMLAMVSGQGFWLVRKKNRSNSSLLQRSAQFLMTFSHAYLYYAYGAHMPFLCTGTYRTGDNHTFAD